MFSFYFILLKLFDKFAGDGGEARYGCPISGCSWVCGKEEMRKGPAVLHLLKAHNIQPLEMHERGIKFHKIMGSIRM